jgi:hypothetical protein
MVIASPTLRWLLKKRRFWLRIMKRGAGIRFIKLPDICAGKLRILTLPESTPRAIEHVKGEGEEY